MSVCYKYGQTAQNISHYHHIFNVHIIIIIIIIIMGLGSGEGIYPHPLQGHMMQIYSPSMLRTICA
jgi:hypothetical protein